MSAESLIGWSWRWRVLAYLSTRCCARRGSDMTANGWLQIALLRARGAARDQAARALPRARSTTGRSRWLAPGRAAALPRWPASTRTRSSTGRATRRDAALQRGDDAADLRRRSGSSTCCRSTRRSSAAVPDRQAFETAASFTTNTNWQSYAGESTMSYLSQMTQLAFHNFISAAVGHGARGRAGPRDRAPLGRAARQLLGRPRPRHALRPAAALARARAAVWCSRA